MPMFTVVGTPGVKRDGIAGKGGIFKSVAISLKNGDGEAVAAEWYCPQATPMPKDGDPLEGDLKLDPQWGWKFSPPYKGGGGGGSKRDPVEDAKTRRSIQMQHAQKCAVEVAKITAGPDVDSAKLLARVHEIARSLYDQCQEVAA